MASWEYMIPMYTRFSDAPSWNETFAWSGRTGQGHKAFPPAMWIFVFCSYYEQNTKLLGGFEFSVRILYVWIDCMQRMITRWLGTGWYNARTTVFPLDQLLQPSLFRVLTGFIWWITWRIADQLVCFNIILIYSVSSWPAAAAAATATATATETTTATTTATATATASATATATASATATATTTAWVYWLLKNNWVVGLWSYSFLWVYWCVIWKKRLPKGCWTEIVPLE